VVAGCFTVDNLRTVVHRVKAFGALPVLGTIPPVNPSVNADRNLWVAAINDEIRQMAAQEGVPVADVYGSMQRKSSNLSSLFFDGVHPNDTGHDAIGEAFFEAVAHGQLTH
jgi:lysophospholipase L1-like esterase